MSSPVPAVSEAKLRELYQALVESTGDRKRRGLDFGQYCYELKLRTLGQGWRAFLKKNHISHKTADSWAGKWAAQGHLQWTPPTTQDFWEKLYHRLNALRPSLSDGAEHRFIKLLDDAVVEKMPATRVEQNNRLYCIKALRDISRSCLEYAVKLETA
jgi:hypothetical protein